MNNRYQAYHRHQHYTQLTHHQVSRYPSKGRRRRVDKTRLPPPIDFYKRLGVNLKGGGEWRMAKCPFHEDQHASLSVSTVHGGYKCHACGVSGDMLSFYMKHRGISFKRACDELDLWGD